MNALINSALYVSSEFTLSLHFITGRNIINNLKFRTRLRTLVKEGKI